jgi:hypothetical protein
VTEILAVLRVSAGKSPEFRQISTIEDDAMMAFDLPFKSRTGVFPA